MSRFIIALVGLLAFAALLWHCLGTRPAAIEADVAACSREALAAAGLGGIDSVVDGRDVRLIGSVPDEDSSRRAEAAVAERCGARVVINELSVAPAPVLPPPAPLAARLCVDGGQLDISGIVPTAADAARFREVAARRFGAEALSGRFDSGAEAPAGAGELLETLLVQARQLERGCIELAGSAVTVAGQVHSEAIRDRLVAAVDAAAGNRFEVAYELSLPALSEEALACQLAYDELLAPGEIVLFDFDSTEIHAEGRALLDRVEEIAEDCPSIAILVTGHTDSTGSSEYNRELSQRRAEAVVAYLVEQGFDRARLTAVGFGETQPRASNESEEGQAMNRRIEFRVRENRP